MLDWVEVLGVPEAVPEGGRGGSLGEGAEGRVVGRVRGGGTQEGESGG